MAQNENYRRFYALLRRLPMRGDREDCKAQLVLQYTGGRTSSLREMGADEYASMCGGMQRLVSDREALRKQRSVVLHLMGELGVATWEWDRVDAFCEQPRIAGKRFAWLSVDELRALGRKLRAILAKQKKRIINP